MFKRKFVLRNAAGGAGDDSGSAATQQSQQTQSAAPAVDVQAAVQKALADQQAEFSKQLKDATGHGDIKSLSEANLKAQGKLQELADAKAQEAQTYKQRFEQSQIQSALLAASSAAVDPAVVRDLLAGRAACDENGQVTIDGKPVADAVTQLLKDKPFLAKAEGGTGSGAPQQTGGGKQLTRAEFEKLSPLQQSEHCKQGGTVV